MKQETQVALVRRILDHIAARTTDTADRPSTLPIAAYVDEARLARENAVLFRELPLPIAHRSMLPNPGDFITHDLSGVPLLLIRRDDGTVGAFLNVCRHRGTRVEPAPCGSKKAFSCPYHAWTYARDGRLLTIPHERGFAGIEKKDRGLVAVPVAEHAGFVWVRPSPSSSSTVSCEPESWLGDLAADLVGFGVDTAHVYEERHFVKSLSWKLALDVFLEAYHLKTTHHETIYPMFFDNLAVVEPHGPHLRNLFPKRSIRELPGQPEDSWRLRVHANILYHLFPNTLVLIQPDHAAIVNVWPDGPARSKLQTYTLIPEPATTEKARAHWDANNAILYGATDEDFTNGESIQRGLLSGANHEVVFGAFEHGLAHFHREIERRTTTSAGK
jgi:phenylpropionate dioxygenase-like ring-hydroxylating dioxygenase large terminal subunit